MYVLWFKTVRDSNKVNLLIFLKSLHYIYRNKILIISKLEIHKPSDKIHLSKDNQIKLN